MSWLTNPLPGIRRFLDVRRSKAPNDYWQKCPMTGQLAPRAEIAENLWVFPGESEYHFPVGAHERLTMTFDGGRWKDIPVPQVPSDPLGFRDKKRHRDRLKEAAQKTGTLDAIALGFGTIENVPVVIAAHDFRFVGGTLGTAAGETVIAGITSAIKKKVPFIIFTASGGARLQEGILGVMQMPRTTVAVLEMREARLPFIVVLTNPTMGGTTASYAMLGDIHIAEPGAQIGFAGRRVIEETTREIPPEGFQDAEKLLERGMVDKIVHRSDMRATLARLCRLLLRAPADVTPG